MLIQKDTNELIKTEIEGLFMDSDCNFYKQYKGGLRLLKPHVVSWGWIGIKINQKEYYCHRLIGKYILGIADDIFITFKNGDKTDIRPDNLRGKFTRHYKKYTVEQGLFISLGILDNFVVSNKRLEGTIHPNDFDIYKGICAS